MLARFAPLVFAAALSLPLAAQQARFIKVDIVSKDGMHHHHGAKGARKDSDGPTTVKMRVPVALATSALQCAQDSEIKVNGETKKGIKTEELVKMLQAAKPGDLLLEIDTNDGDHVRITIE